MFFKDGNKVGDLVGADPNKLKVNKANLSLETWFTESRVIDRMLNRMAHARTAIDRPAQVYLSDLGLSIVARMCKCLKLSSFFFPRSIVVFHGVRALISALVALPSMTSSDTTLPVPGPRVIPQQLWPLATHRPSLSLPMTGLPVRTEMGR
jgi:hypothetical protein